ncbi:MAG: phosphoenolpyruvate--protein phosphotransferase [Pseudomonadota bacterium]
MLSLLRRLVQEVNAASSLAAALEIIVERVQAAIAVDVCSIYLRDDGHQVLMATRGLKPESVGEVRLDLDQGLIGLVCERAEPLNLEEASSHPRYQYFPETGEEAFHSFLGVPIIRHSEVVGVLTAQRTTSERFDEDSVSFLVTVASQLAAAIAHAEVTGGINDLLGKRTGKDLPLIGLAGSSGVAMGTAIVQYPQADLDAIPDRQVDDPKAEINALNQAVAEVRRDIQDILVRLEEQKLPMEDRALFEVYLMMLDSGGMIDKVIEYIRAGSWASGALKRAVEEHVKVFESMEDPYLSERASDVRDLGIRILSYLQSAPAKKSYYPRHTILVGEEISATMLAEVPASRLAGVISVRGSSNSHVAILARSMGIPAVMGVADLPVHRIDSQRVIVDGYQGKVFIRPSAAVRAEYKRLIQEASALSAELDTLIDEPALTPDGVRIPLYANTGLLADIAPSLKCGAEGVGLYRTEFPFIIRDRFPGEEEQFRIYRQVMLAFPGKPVVVRTLDIGGDKALSYFPIQEENPFLGWRGIRITLDHPEIFLVQMRAILRASEGIDNLNILLPMITNVAEVEAAKELLVRAVEELREEGRAVDMPRLGVMIEVPAAVYQAEALAKRVDFLSVGTNDLTQYLLAVDRNNSSVAHLFDGLHPAVLQALMQVIKAAHKHRKPVSVCGEMAGDPAAALVLLGMGVDSLSMNAASLPRVKWVIRNFTQAKAKELLGEVLTMLAAEEIRQRLNDALDAAGLGGLLRPGR